MELKILETERVRVVKEQHPKTHMEGPKIMVLEMVAPLKCGYFFVSMLGFFQKITFLGSTKFVHESWGAILARSQAVSPS